MGTFFREKAAGCLCFYQGGLSNIEYIYISLSPEEAQSKTSSNSCDWKNGYTQIQRTASLLALWSAASFISSLWILGQWKAKDYVTQEKGPTFFCIL